MPHADLDWEGMDPPGPMTESSKERGYERDVDEDALGRSEEIDQEDGDIADEGTGHRG
jgi:hypothetical protein